MNKYKKLASNTIILAIGQFSSKFLLVIMMRFYTGLLDTDGYGMVSLIIDICVILIPLVTLSISDSLIRFGLDRKYDNTQVFSIGITTAVIGLLIFALISPALKLIKFDGVSPFENYIIWIYFYVVSGSIKSCSSLFARSIGYVKLFAIDGIVTTITNILFNLIFMQLLKMGIEGYLLSVILSDALSIAFMFYMADLKKYIKLSSIKPHLVGSMYRYSLPLIPTNIMWWIIGVSAGFFITSFVSIDATGLYKAAYRFPNIIITISLIFSQAWNMSAITEKNSRTISQFYSNVFGFLQSAIYIMAAGLMLIIRPAMRIMTAEAFHEAYRFSPILTLAVIFTCFSTFMGSVYIASKESVRSMVTAIIGAVVNTILNLIFIPLWGINGAGIATLVSYIIIFIIRSIDTRRIILIDLHLTKMTVNIILLIIMSVIVINVKNNIIYNLSLLLIFLVVVLLNFNSALKAFKMVRNKRG